MSKAETTDPAEEPAFDPTLCYVATVEWFRGNRGIDRVIQNADLGLTGCGVKERVKITYKPGEIVTEERVMAGVKMMIKLADDERTAFRLSCPRVVLIELQNADAQRPEERGFAAAN